MDELAKRWARRLEGHLYAAEHARVLLGDGARVIQRRAPRVHLNASPSDRQQRCSSSIKRIGLKSHGKRRGEEGPELSSVDQLVVRVPVKVQRRTWSQAATSTVSAPHHGMRTGCVGVGW